MGELFLSLGNYSIYKNNGYYLCVSNQEINNYQMFMSFSDKDLTKLSDNDIVNEIKRVSNLLFSRSSDLIYVLPIIDPTELERAASINDDRAYNRILEKIYPITFDVHQKFSARKKRINDVIGMIRQTDVDQKIIHWLDIKLMEISHKDCIQDVDINQLIKYRDKDIFSEWQSSPFLQEAPSSSIAPINREDDAPIQNKQNAHVRKLVKPKINDDVSPGFSSMKFIVMILSIALLVGVAIAAWLIK